MGLTAYKSQKRDSYWFSPLSLALVSRHTPLVLLVVIRISFVSQEHQDTPEALLGPWTKQTKKPQQPKSILWASASLQELLGLTDWQLWLGQTQHIRVATNV